MRKTFLSAVAVAALMTLPSIATAGDNGWYARAGVGIGTLDDMTFSGGLNGTVDSASDIRPTLGFGKYLNDDGWRLDFDLTQRYNDTGLVGEHAFSDSGFNSWSVMANIIKDFDVGMAVKPYLGVGAGIADVDLSAHGFQNGVSLTDPYAIAHDSATTFAWNALVGLGWDLSDNLAFDLGYRYFQAQSLDFASSNAAA
ncbi:MAG: hypothetical protein COA47_03985 [Robiginitomaculum sp.]|nr:MAG: hypothetical protein COA47_03985 [Robiginitomaculum sp.]